jgi:hypothetical protein
MKKISALLFIVFALSAPFMRSSVARAYSPQPGYARILKDGVMLYKTSALNDNLIFFNLPRTYYIRIIDVNAEGECYEAEYQSNQNGYVNIVGFVRKSDVAIWQNSSQPLFPDISATALAFTYVYERPGASAVKVSISEGQTIKLYGSVNGEDDLLYYYVIRGGYEGYVRADMLDINYPPPHPDPMPTPTPTPQPSPSVTATPAPAPQDGENGSENLVQILLISAICIPALIIVYLMFRPGKKIKRNYREYYDGEDDEA